MDTLKRPSAQSTYRITTRFKRKGLWTVAVITPEERIYICKEPGTWTPGAQDRLPHYIVRSAESNLRPH